MPSRYSDHPQARIPNEAMRDFSKGNITKFPSLAEPDSYQTLYGNEKTGVIATSYFPGSFYFVTNLKLQDFADSKMFPKGEGVKSFLSRMRTSYGGFRG